MTVGQEPLAHHGAARCVTLVTSCQDQCLPEAGSLEGAPEINHPNNHICSAGLLDKVAERHQSLQQLFKSFLVIQVSGDYSGNH